MRVRQTIKDCYKPIARVLAPKNLKRILAKIIEDLRVAASESTSATGRFLLSIPLGMLCGILYVAKAVKWFFRVLRTLGSIILAEVAFHTGFLARTSVRLKKRWTELQQALSSRVSTLWNDILGVELEEEDESAGRLWELTREALICSSCWFPRLAEAVLAIAWGIGSVIGLAFVLIFRRSFPLEIFGAATFLIIPPFLQHGVRTWYSKTSTKSTGQA